MEILGFFVTLLFLYTLVARRLEESVLTSPIIFTTAGIIFGLILPKERTHVVEHETALLVAEIALVLLLFTEAS
ncbi:MAG TPA: sodium:proton exchanger, partial [Anaerolineae bacterium]|nr:sodium:proton exchanger [Anaerolineae bacterium]